MAKEPLNIPPDATLRSVAYTVLNNALCKMMDNAEGTRLGAEKSEPDAEGIEYLHDMRVGSRRLRAALAVFGSIFPKEQFETFDKYVGRITDALGAVRDLDVQLETLQKLQSSLPENEAYGIGRLIRRQTKLRNRERLGLLEALARLEKERFERKFHAALEKAAPPKAPAPTSSETVEKKEAA